jgi:3-oxoacyl-[acyl-carrier-protein] synthase III
MTVAIRQTYIDGLAYELGEQEHDLDDLTSVLPGVRNSLRDAGLASYRTTTRSPVELARGPMQDTLSVLSPDEMDRLRRVVFATNSVDSPSMAGARDLSRLLADSGMPQAFPIGVFMSFCANFQSALETARALIATGQDDAVLVVCTDVMAPDRSRMVEPKISITSDAAVSFLVTVSEGPFRVLETRLRANSILGSLDRGTEFVQYMDGATRALVGLVEETLGAAAISYEQVALAIPNNYNHRVCTYTARSAGFDESLVFLDNIPRFAHAVAADNPINLRDCWSGGRIGSGDIVGLIGSGAFQWGCTLVEVMADPSGDQ